MFINEFNQSEHVSVERFRTVPSEARNVEICLSDNDKISRGEFVRHLLIHISNVYEDRIIKPSDVLCFDFYGRTLSLKISKIHTLPSVDLAESMQNISLDEQFFRISSSTTWSIKNHMDQDSFVYPVSSVGGLSDIYEKLINIVQKMSYKSKHCCY